MLTRLACKYEGGAIWWRGSNERWAYMLPTDAEALLRVFAADREPYARDYARQLRAVLTTYHNQHFAGAA